MSIAHLAPAMTRPSSRWLLLGSLALNLFFIGVVVALAIRSPAPAPGWDRDIFVRVERIADTLPAPDAATLRADRRQARQHRKHASKIPQRPGHYPRGDAGRAIRRRSLAVGDGEYARAARQAFDQTIQGAFADAAGQMSHAGRQALADWPPGRKSTGGKP